MIRDSSGTAAGTNNHCTVDMLPLCSCDLRTQEVRARGSLGWTFELVVRPGSDAVVWDKYEGVAAAVQVGSYGFARGLATLTMCHELPRATPASPDRSMGPARGLWVDGFSGHRKVHGYGIVLVVIGEGMQNAGGMAAAVQRWAVLHGDTRPGGWVGRYPW